MPPVDDLITTTEMAFIERTLILNETTLVEISKHHSVILDISNDNRTIIMNEVELESMEEHLVNEVYIVIALTLMVFSSITCVCMCLLYHKYQQWHQHVLESRPPTAAPIPSPDTDSLPSYTIVTGLPSYEEALEQLRQMRLVRKSSVPVMKYSGAAPNDEVDRPGLVFTRLSIGDLVKFHKQEKCKFLC
ncbi:hypothetical protein M8J77_003744 [Diaphorina citri]|nr:hypothetical protein M8J77_003744 [Diaphorina citri]